MCCVHIHVSFCFGCAMRDSDIATSAGASACSCCSSACSCCSSACSCCSSACSCCSSACSCYSLWHSLYLEPLCSHPLIASWAWQILAWCFPEKPLVGAEYAYFSKSGNTGLPLYAQVIEDRLAFLCLSSKTVEWRPATRGYPGPAWGLRPCVFTEGHEVLPDDHLAAAILLSEAVIKGVFVKNGWEENMTYDSLANPCVNYLSSACWLIYIYIYIYIYTRTHSRQIDAYCNINLNRDSFCWDCSEICQRTGSCQTCLLYQ